MSKFNRAVLEQSQLQTKLSAEDSEWRSWSQKDSAAFLNILQNHVDDGFKKEVDKTWIKALEEGLKKPELTEWCTILKGFLERSTAVKMSISLAKKLFSVMEIPEVRKVGYYCMVSSFMKQLELNLIGLPLILSSCGRLKPVNDRIIQGILPSCMALSLSADFAFKKAVKMHNKGPFIFFCLGLIDDDSEGYLIPNVCACPDESALIFSTCLSSAWPAVVELAALHASPEMLSSGGMTASELKSMTNGTDLFVYRLSEMVQSQNVSLWALLQTGSLLTCFPELTNQGFRGMGFGSDHCLRFVGCVKEGSTDLNIFCNPWGFGNHNIDSEEAFSNSSGEIYCTDNFLLQSLSTIQCWVVHSPKETIHGEAHCDSDHLMITLSDGTLIEKQEFVVTRQVAVGRGYLVKPAEGSEFIFKGSAIVKRISNISTVESEMEHMREVNAALGYKIGLKSSEATLALRQIRLVDKTNTGLDLSTVPDHIVPVSNPVALSASSGCLPVASMSDSNPKLVFIAKMNTLAQIHMPVFPDCSIDKWYITAKDVLRVKENLVDHNLHHFVEVGYLRPDNCVPWIASDDMRDPVLFHFSDNLRSMDVKLVNPLDRFNRAKESVKRFNCSYKMTQEVPLSAIGMINMIPLLPEKLFDVISISPKETLGLETAYGGPLDSLKGKVNALLSKMFKKEEGSKKPDKRFGAPRPKILIRKTDPASRIPEYRVEERKNMSMMSAELSPLKDGEKARVNYKAIREMCKKRFLQAVSVMDNPPGTSTTSDEADRFGGVLGSRPGGNLILKGK